MRLRFWLRWAARDLRQRWLQVLAIALIIALGTGVYSGLGGQEAFRVASLDRSYALVSMYDLRLTLTPGSYLPQEQAEQAFADVEGVRTVEPRLVLDTQLEVVGREDEVQVAARILGVDTRGDGPRLNRAYLEAGRDLGRYDERHALVEAKFARHHDVEPGDRLRFAGDLEVRVVGSGQLPEYFMVMPPGAIFTVLAGEAAFAVVHLPLATAQAYDGRPAQVNEMLFEFAPDADADAVAAAIEEVAVATFPGVGASVSRRADDPVHNLLYTDAVEDQAMFDFFAWVLLAGATLAAFNLAGRVVESQRRQLGIGMALGVPRAQLAVRPLLIGVQIALLGTLLGLAAGLAFSWLMGGLFTDVMPLPEWVGTMVHGPSFLTAAALGVLLPLVATLIPVWRAVRAPPLDALHGHLIARSSGLNRWLRRLRLPGSMIAQMPWKNALGSVRRSGLTVLGIATAAVLLSLFFGIRDTFVGTVDGVSRAFLHGAPDRLTVVLRGFRPPAHPEIEQLRGLQAQDGRPLVAVLEPELVLPATLRAEEAGEALSVSLAFVDRESRIWTPTLLEGELRGPAEGVADAPPGLVISRKLADDLGLAVGAEALLQHPRRTFLLMVGSVDTPVTIMGIHDNPVRALAYLDRGHVGITGLGNSANVLTMVPAEGVKPEALRRILFGQPGVASVQSVAETIAALDEALELVTRMIAIIQGVVVLLAFLIAFNATTINLDDRAREIATMFAFGLRPRTVVRLQAVENLLLGLAGAAVGLAVGIPLLHRFMAVRMEDMLEELGLVVTLAPGTVAVIVALTAGVVALTPLVHVRRLRRLDVPSTLRVME